MILVVHFFFKWFDQECIFQLVFLQNVYIQNNYFGTIGKFLLINIKLFEPIMISSFSFILSVLFLVMIIHLYEISHFLFIDAVSDHAFQWLSTGMSRKFLSPWECFLLIRTSLYMSWESGMAEQVQDSGLTC